MLEERLLIETQHTSVFTQEGLKGNGKLRYKIPPIQGAIDEWNRRGLAQIEATGKFHKKWQNPAEMFCPKTCLPVDGGRYGPYRRVAACVPI